MINDIQETKQKNSPAIPLQTIIVVMVAIGFIISFTLMYFMYQTSKRYGEMRSSTENYIASQDIAADLLAGSDELTVYARGFVVTGIPSRRGFIMMIQMRRMRSKKQLSRCANIPRMSVYCLSLIMQCS